MKEKGKKIFLALYTLIVIVGAFITPEVEASERDIMIYRISSVFLLGVIWIAFFCDFNIFNVRKHVPLLKSGKVSKRIVFWIIILCVASFGMVGIQSTMSSEYKEAINNFNAAKDWSYTEVIKDDEQSTEKTKVEQETEENSEKSIETKNKLLQETTAQETTTSKSVVEKEEKITKKNKVKTIVEKHSIQGSPKNVVGYNSFQKKIIKVAKKYSCEKVYIEKQTDGSIYVEFYCEKGSGIERSIIDEIYEVRKESGYSCYTILTFIDKDKPEKAEDIVFYNAEIDGNGEIYEYMD